MILAIFLCVFTTTDIFNTWNENPVVVTIDDKGTRISTILFPAVTVCPTKRFDVDEGTTLSQLLHYFTRSGNMNYEPFITDLTSKESVKQCLSLKIDIYSVGL